MMPDLFLSQIQALVLYLAVNELSISSKFSILRLTSPVPIDIALSLGLLILRLLYGAL